MQYTVKKPINNNILRVVDPTGCELIVTGRGLGFGVKPGYKIEAETVERSYRMTSPAVQQKLVELPAERKPAHHAGRPHQFCHSAQRAGDSLFQPADGSHSGILPGRVSPWYGVP